MTPSDVHLEREEEEEEEEGGESVGALFGGSPLIRAAIFPFKSLLRHSRFSMLPRELLTAFLIYRELSLSGHVVPHVFDLAWRWNFNFGFVEWNGGMDWTD